MYGGNELDTGRRDARLALLRVYTGEEDYFQFATAVAPDPSLTLLGAGRENPGAFWLAFCREGCRLIEDAIRRGEIPLKDNRQAYEVFPDVAEAIKKAKGLTEVARVGNQVCQFTI